MNERELHELRKKKWRTDGQAPLRTLDDARSFVEEVGFCLMYPVRPPVLAATFVGAWVGSDEGLPSSRTAFADPRAKEATELMVRLLRDKSAFEASVFEDTNFLVAQSVFPYFYALVGDRNPKHDVQKGGEKLSQLAADTFAAVQREGPVSKRRLLEALGKGISAAALDRALNELWSRLKITRVDYSPAEGASWDVLYRWAGEAVNEGVHLSVPEALSALLSKYLDAVVAAEQKEVEDFFSRLVARSKVREAIHALLGARELSFVQVGGKAMIQVTPPRAPRQPRQGRPMAGRSRRG